jgi:hypothetical protein
MQAPVYQYRIILPFDENVVNCSTDMDFNVDGDVKASITKNIKTKTSFTVRSFSLSLFYFVFNFFSNIM